MASERLLAWHGDTWYGDDSVGFQLDTYATISGAIDYGAKTYTVFVDDVQRYTDVSGGNLDFNNVNSDNAYIRVGNWFGDDESKYREWNLDNISIIPEPSSMALLGLSLGSLLMLRRRKV